MMNLSDKKITMEDIITFVNQAIEENYNIMAAEQLEGHIQVLDKNSQNYVIICISGGKLSITTSNGYVRYKEILSDVDKAKFTILRNKCIEYVNNLAYKEFYNFFTNSKPLDINDLEDNDD